MGWDHDMEKRKKDLLVEQKRLRDEAVDNLDACVQCAGTQLGEGWPSTVVATAWFYVPKAKRKLQACCDDHAQKIRILKGRTTVQLGVLGVLTYFEFPSRPTPEEILVVEVLES